MNTNETIENSPQKETKLINRHAYIKQLLQSDCSNNFEQAMKYFFPNLTDFTLDNIAFGGITDFEVCCSFCLPSKKNVEQNSLSEDEIDEGQTETVREDGRYNFVLFCMIKPNFDQEYLDTITYCMTLKGCLLKNQIFAVCSQIRERLSQDECKTICGTRDIAFVTF